MGIFKFLVNDLLGTKREYEVKGLGIFTCNVCDWWRDKDYTWSGMVQLPGNKFRQRNHYRLVGNNDFPTLLNDDKLRH